MAIRSRLILGGARSGKSARALHLTAPPRCLVATARPDPADAELADRIERHRRERAADWTLIEEPLELAAALGRAGRTAHAVVVDCLTLWLGNLLLAERDPEPECVALGQAVAACPGQVILVSNELGMGLHPASGLARSFRDAHGRMNQQLADQVDRVELVVAGQVLVVK